MLPGETPLGQGDDYLENGTMSDKPLGPGWWLASDGTWHPPELHPSIAGGTGGPAAPTAVPSGAPVATTDAGPQPDHAPTPPAASPAATAAVPGLPVMGADQTAAATTAPAPTPADAPVVGVQMPPLGPVAPRPVPSLSDVPPRAAVVAESDRRQEAGPMFPDLFQQAVAGSALANAVTVNFADGEQRDSLDAPPTFGPAAESQVLVAAGGRMPAEVGEFTGASAKKRRWRH